MLTSVPSSLHLFQTIGTTNWRKIVGYDAAQTAAAASFGSWRRAFARVAAGFLAAPSPHGFPMRLLIRSRLTAGFNESRCWTVIQLGSQAPGQGNALEAGLKAALTLVIEIWDSCPSTMRRVTYREASSNTGLYTSILVINLSPRQEAAYQLEEQFQRTFGTQRCPTDLQALAAAAEAATASDGD